MSYDELPDESFWRRCLSEPDFRIDAIYRPRVLIGAEEAVATAGSCFAQKIGRELRGSSARFLDLEPVPFGLSEASAAGMGFGLFSARYGNIYGAAQLVQLAEDALAGRLREGAFWQKEGRWYDGLRPRLEPGGFATLDEAQEARLAHLVQVRRMFRAAGVFIFTLGLTERWEDGRTGTVWPICPAVVDPAFGDAAHRFHDARLGEVVADLERFIALVRAGNPGLRVIFTVSPVPLMATATGGHVLGATGRGKAVLRAAVDEVCARQEGCDYFPSYEIAMMNPARRDAFGPDGREVRAEVVEEIMRVFFAGQRALRRRVAGEAGPGAEGVDICDEVLLGAVRE